MVDFDGLSHFGLYLVPLVALLIPIVAIIGGIMYRARRDELLHETVRQLSERGQPIPPELFDGGLGHMLKSGMSRRRGSPLRSGAINIAVGLGLMAMFWAMQPGRWLWAIGCVPLFIGIAMLLVWRLESKEAGLERQ